MTRNILSALIAAVAASLMLVATWNQGDDGGPDGAAYSSMLYPRIILAVILLPSLWILGNEAWTRRRKRMHAAEEPKLLGVRGGLFTLLATVAYVVLIDVIGFPLASIAVMFVVGWLLGYKRWLLLGVVSVITGVGIWLVMARGLNIPLPTGLWD